MKLKNIAVLFALGIMFFSCSEKTEQYDVVIIGGGASGTTAGIQSARMNAKTLIVEGFDWLGGMLTSAGVSATDGNYKLRGAIWGEFRDALEKHYGGADSLKTGWVSHVLFEPSVGDKIFKNLCAAEKNLSIWYRSTASNFDFDGEFWNLNIDKNGETKQIKTKVLIDATELGDIAKSVGVPYDLGMDARKITNEDIAPEEANGIIQDLTYVMILKDYGKDVTIEKPEDYDPTSFLCCCTNPKCVAPKEEYRLWDKEMMITYGKLPNNKYMINWPLEGNDYYLNIVEMTPTERIAALKKAKNHSLQFLYFLQTELGFQNLGLADDEYPTEDRLPFIPYHRESRRIHGLVQFDVNHMVAPYSQTQALYRTAVGVGDYPVDHHHTRYHGWEELPNLYFHPVPSYGFPLGVMIPKNKKNFIVAEKSISVTNIANGSTRLQPVVLQIGQAAGALAALAAEKNIDVAEVSVRDVQKQILAAGGYLLPYLDRPSTDKHFKAMQRIGATGILRGRGQNVGWANETWFDADTTVSVKTLLIGFSEVYPIEYKESEELINIDNLAEIISNVTDTEKEKVIYEIKSQWQNLELENYDEQRPLTCLECAVVIDKTLNPFEKEIDIFGNFK